jgi:hypothetical protein
MRLSDLTGESDGPATLIPVVTASKNALILPLTDRYIDYCFKDASVNGAVKDWANRLRPTPAGTGLDGHYILELIKQQNTKDIKFIPPEMPLALGIDFTSPIDVVVVSVGGATRRYKVTLAAYTSIPLFVNAKTGNDESNNGSSWGDAFASLEKALTAANPNDNDRVPKEIWLAGEEGQIAYYDINGVEIVNKEDPSGSTDIKTAEKFPPWGGVMLVGGFRGIESKNGSAEEEMHNDPDTYPVVVYNSKPSNPAYSNGDRVGNTALVVRGVPVTLERLTLSGRKDPRALSSEKQRGVYLGQRESGLLGYAYSALTLNIRALITDCDVSGYTPGSGADNGQPNGGGVYVSYKSRLYIENGSLYVEENGKMYMPGGEIGGNTAVLGGGVYAEYGEVHILHGRINGNTATSNGGGVFLDYDKNTGSAGYNNGVLFFKAGQINGNLAGEPSVPSSLDKGNGGGVYVNVDESGSPSANRRGEFYMGQDRNGLSANEIPEIRGNIAISYGGGVYVSYRNDTVLGVFKKAPQITGNPSGVIYAHDGNVPVALAADRDPQTKSNVALANTAISDPWSPNTAIQPGAGHAVFITAGAVVDNILGAYMSYDAQSPSAVDADGTIHTFEVKYRDGSNIERYADVAVVHDANSDTTDDAASTNPNAYIPGRIRVSIPAEVIDNYTAVTGGNASWATVTDLSVDAASLLLEVPYDVEVEDDALKALFPTKAGAVRSGAPADYSGGMPASSSKDPVQQARQLFVDFNSTTLGWIPGEANWSFQTAKSRYTTKRGSGGSYNQIKRDFGNIPMTNFGLAPWYVVIDANKRAHVYIVEVTVTGMPVIKVDSASTSTVRDGKTWRTPFLAVASALAAVPGTTPADIWIKKPASALSFSALNTGTNVGFAGGFEGYELTKKQRANPLNNIVSLNVSPVFPGNTNITLEYIAGSVAGAASVMLNPQDTFVLGESVQFRAPIKGAAAGVIMNKNAVLAGPIASTTGVTLEGGFLTMNGAAEISGWNGGAAIIKNGTMEMNESAMIRNNTRANQAAVSSEASAAGISLYNATLTLNGLPSAYQPDATMPNYYPYNTPPTIRNNRADVASGKGGGIYAKRSDIIFASVGAAASPGGVVEQNNVTAGNGGGIYLDEQSTVMFRKGAIRGNTAAGVGDTAGNGGGVYMTGPHDLSKFVNLGSSNPLTAAYNNGTILNMTSAADLTALTNDPASTAVIAGNTAQKGGGVYLKAGTMLFRTGSKGAIFGNDAAGQDANTAPTAAALYDENSLVSDSRTRLFRTQVDISIWGSTDAASYPPERSQTIGYTSANTYIPENQPNRDNRLTSFIMSANGTPYKAAIIEDTGNHAPSYLHPGEMTIDAFAAASGTINIKLLLSDVQQAVDSGGISLLIQPLAKSTINAGSSGVKILLPAELYEYYAGSGSMTNDKFGPRSGNYDEALQAMFKGVAASFNHTLPPPSNFSQNPLFETTAVVAKRMMASSGYDSLNQLQAQADSPYGVFAYKDSVLSGGAGQDNLHYDQVSPPPGAQTKRPALYCPVPATGALPEAPTWNFTAVEGVSTYTLYSISESGNIRKYTLNVSVYTAAPRYVNSATQNAVSWGDIPGTNLQTALVAASKSENQSDIWIKGSSTNITFSAASPSWTFNKSPVILIGGFLGSESTPEERPARIALSPSASWHQPQYRIDGIANIASNTAYFRTTGPNFTSVALGSVTVRETQFTLRDIKASFTDLVVGKGGTVRVENAILLGNVTLNEGGRLIVGDSTRNTTAEGRESLVSGGTLIVGSGTGRDAKAGDLLLNAGQIYSPVKLLNQGTTFVMNGRGAIVVSSAAASGGVQVGSAATFEMNGGIIMGSGESVTGAVASGVGVFVTAASSRTDAATFLPDYDDKGGYFRMSAGYIKNMASAGVKIGTGGEFDKASATAIIYGPTQVIASMGNGYTIEDGNFLDVPWANSSTYWPSAGGSAVISSFGAPIIQGALPGGTQPYYGDPGKVGYKWDVDFGTAYTYTTTKYKPLGYSKELSIQPASAGYKGLRIEITNGSLSSPSVPSIEFGVYGQYPPTLDVDGSVGVDGLSATFLPSLAAPMNAGKTLFIVRPGAFTQRSAQPTVNVLIAASTF